MKIGELQQHCGDCGLVSYCGNPYCYCLCHDERFSNIDEATYAQIADNCSYPPYPPCGNCDEDCENKACDLDDEARDYRCTQIADFVFKKLEEGHD